MQHSYGGHKQRTKGDLDKENVIQLRAIRYEQMTCTQLHIDLL